MVKDIFICTPLDIRNAVALVLAELGGVAEDREFCIRLVLNELLANSVQHSAGQKTVFSYSFREDRICCMITDDGEWANVPLPICSDVDDIHGRGVFLANCYAEELVYDTAMKSVRFSIRIR